MTTVTTVTLRDDDTRELRKARGAFFTPDALTRHVTEWAVRSSADVVLEPSCGEAAFLLAAGERLVAPWHQGERHGQDQGRGTGGVQLHGIELHEASAAHARTMLGEAGFEADVRTGDFFLVPPDGRFDAVVGNPPYVRYQDFSGDARARSREAALRAGVRLTGLASSWAAFTVHASLFLKPGGRLGLVLPAELLSVNYAAEVRRYLLECFRGVRLVLFTERVFPDVMEEVVLLLADGFGDGPTDCCEVYQCHNADDLDSAVGQSWKPAAPEDKWTPSLLSAEALSAIERVQSAGSFTTLHGWGETTLGMVTGNNKYFAMTPDAVRERGFRADEVLRISPPGSRHLRGLTLTEPAWTALGTGEQSTHLFRPHPDGRLSAAARRYIAEGEGAGVDTAYKCRVRKPWWRVPLVKPAQLLLTYMNADTPRLCTNAAQVHHLNSVHGVYLRPGMIRAGTDLLPLAALSSMTLLGAETVGRAYGGGMLKIEPREADRLPVPTRDVLESARADLTAAQPRVMHALRTRRVTDAAEMIDDLLLVRHLGMRRSDVAALRDARESLHSRRVARGAGPGSH